METFRNLLHKWWFRIILSAIGAVIIQEMIACSMAKPGQVRPSGNSVSWLFYTAVIFGVMTAYVNRYMIFPNLGRRRGKDFDESEE